MRMSYLTISPSPLSCCIHRLCCSRTVTSTPRSCPHLPCPTVPDPKARAKRTSARAARSLATWPIPRTPQVMSSKSSTRLLLQTETRRQSTIRTTITSLTSRKSHARTLDCSVFPQCQKPLFRSFLMMKSKDSMHRETVARHRERERKRKFCDQCCRVDVKEKVGGTVLGVIHSLQTLSSTSCSC